MKKLFIALTLLGCAETHPVNSTTSAPTYVSGELTCLTDRSVCLNQTAQLCKRHNFDGFIIEGERTCGVMTEKEIKILGYEMAIKCVDCQNTEQLCYHSTLVY
jgi:hypothetical protein